MARTAHSATVPLCTSYGVVPKPTDGGKTAPGLVPELRETHTRTCVWHCRQLESLRSTGRVGGQRTMTRPPNCPMPPLPTQHVGRAVFGAAAMGGPPSTVNDDMLRHPSKRLVRDTCNQLSVQLSHLHHPTYMNYVVASRRLPSFPPRRDSRPFVSQLSPAACQPCVPAKTCPRRKTLLGPGTTATIPSGSGPSRFALEPR